MATVVVTLVGVTLVSSCGTLASVITASVVTGGISLTAPTRVVFPAPKPPATTILVDIFVCASLEKSFETTKSPLQNLVFRRAVTRDGRVDVDEAQLGQVAEQHLGDPQRDLQLGGDLGDGARLAAQQVDVLGLRHQVLGRVVARVRRGDQGLHHERVPRPGPPTGEGEGPDTRAAPAPAVAHNCGVLFMIRVTGMIRMARMTRMG